MAYQTITLEEHFISSNAVRAQEAIFASYTSSISPSWLPKLQDISPDGSRIKAMDSGNVGVQVLSNSAGVSSLEPELVAAANDELAAATSAQPRFKGFAALPMKHPSVAAAEFRRCVEQLGFVGALIDNHLDDGRYYDGDEYGQVFETAQALDVPIYIHPTFPTKAVNDALFKGNYDPKLELGLSISGWGWHSDTALSLLRLYAAGVFDRFPKLKIVVGHMGEMIPFMLQRIDQGLQQLVDGRSLTFKQVWDQNIWITTSGMFSVDPMACLLRNTKIDRIMFSVDYPYSHPDRGHEFLKNLQDSGLVSEEQLHLIAYKNAESFLKIKLNAL